MSDEQPEEPTDWDRQKAFWATPGRVDTYDLVHQGGYDSYNAMEKQKPGDVMTAGEWVRAEDYRAAVERLEAQRERLLELRETILAMVTSWYPPAAPGQIANELRDWQTREVEIDARHRPVT